MSGTSVSLARKDLQSRQSQSSKRGEIWESGNMMNGTIDGLYAHNKLSRSSTASTPPATTTSDSVDIFYMCPSIESTTKTRLSPILEDKYMPSLMPASTFTPESSVRNDDHRSLSPPPTTGTILYRGLVLTHLKAEEHVLTEHAQYNDYHYVYIPNICEAIAKMDAAYSWGQAKSTTFIVDEGIFCTKQVFRF
ncbi:hypothetical protein P692DRAFT_20879050 [Suillus brevipes Sb2]|nr:hypothetical protein P692DRAFT_20879050 [Suillus brevipes Sb2]